MSRQLLRVAEATCADPCGPISQVAQPAPTSPTSYVAGVHNAAVAHRGEGHHPLQRRSPPRPGRRPTMPPRTAPLRRKGILSQEPFDMSCSSPPSSRGRRDWPEPDTIDSTRTDHILRRTSPHSPSRVLVTNPSDGGGHQHDPSSITAVPAGLEQRHQGINKRLEWVLTSLDLESLSR